MAIEGKTNKKGKRPKRRKPKYGPASDQQIADAYNSVIGYVHGMPGNTFSNVHGNINVAPYTTIQGKRTEFKNKSGGVNFEQEAPVTMEPKLPKGAKAGKRGGGGYDPYANLPTMQDVQSESLGILDDLVQGMLGDQGSASYDYESALQGVVKGIRKAYAADISAIRGNIKDARKDTKRDRREIEAMYKGLARSYGKSMRESEASGDSAVAEVNQIAGNASQSVQDANTQLMNERMEMLKGLGIEEAAPAVTDETPGQTMSALEQIAQNQQIAATNLQSNAEANKQFFRSGRQGARMEGTNRSLDALENFRDYKRANKDQIRSLKGQRAREVAGAKQSAQAQAAEMQANAEAETWSRLMEYLGMRSDLEQQNIENMLDANQFQWDQYMDIEGLKNDRRKLNSRLREDKRDFLLDKYKAKTGRISATQPNSSSSGGGLMDFLPKSVSNPTNLISQSGLPAQSAQKVNRILEGLRESEAWRFGKVRGPGDQNYDLSPEQAAQIAEQAGRAAGLSAKEIKILRLAAMASV